MLPAVVLAFVLGGAPQSVALQDPGRAGWAALNAGKIEQAAVAFEEALQKRPTDATLLLGAGVAAHLRGRTDEARRALGDALRQDRSLTTASLLLGEILYRGGDLDGAIAVYQQGLAAAPGNTRLAARLEAWQKEADLHGRFGQRLGDHFTVLFEGPAEADLATAALTTLEAAYWRIGAALNAYPAEAITVVLYTREQFQDITQSPGWAGGLFDGRIRLPVQGALQNRREFERVLAHEFTHALVHSVAPRNVPTWLNEGLAVVFEGSDPQARDRQLAAAASRPTLRSLEGSFESLERPAAVVAYAQSAAAVQAMIDTGGVMAVAGLLADLGRGLPFDQAFERNMLVSYATFEATLR